MTSKVGKVNFKIKLNDGEKKRKANFLFALRNHFSKCLQFCSYESFFCSFKAALNTAKNKPKLLMDRLTISCQGSLYGVNQWAWRWQISDRLCPRVFFSCWFIYQGPRKRTKGEQWACALRSEGRIDADSRWEKKSGRREEKAVADRHEETAASTASQTRRGASRNTFSDPNFSFPLLQCYECSVVSDSLRHFRL